MSAKSFCLAVVLALTLAAGPRAQAQLLTNAPFDFVLQGDDPGAVFYFDLTGHALVPSVARFDGFFQNLDATETGVRYNLAWTAADGGAYVGSLGTGFERLQGSGLMPVHFEQSLGFTPQMMQFHVEGGGPNDHFRFVGNLVIEQVPEPGVVALLGPAVVAAWGWRRWRRFKAAA